MLVSLISTLIVVIHSIHFTYSIVCVDSIDYTLTINYNDSINQCDLMSQINFIHQATNYRHFMHHHDEDYVIIIAIALDYSKISYSLCYQIISFTIYLFH